MRILAVVATLCATNQQLRAMDRWSYCVVDSGRLVNSFVDAVRERYNLQQATGAWCYRPSEDIDREKVSSERDYLIAKSNPVLVVWP